MQNLNEIQKKLNTTDELLNVVKTMKSMASVNMRHFEQASNALEEYKKVLDQAWIVFFQKGGRVSREEDHGTALCFVFGSDQGMCGQFNETVLEKAFTLEKELRDRSLEVVYWTSGARVLGGMEEMGKPVDKHFSLPSGISGIEDKVLDAVNNLERWNREKGSLRLYLCHNKMKKGGHYSPETQKVLPIDENWLQQYARTEWPQRNIPMLGLPPDRFFSHCFSQYLFISLYRALGQSLSSENAARLASMQSAEKNIEELKESLQGKYREQRQIGITNELLDIVSGFEALKSGNGETPVAY